MTGKQEARLLKGALGLPTSAWNGHESLCIQSVSLCKMLPCKQCQEASCMRPSCASFFITKIEVMLTSFRVSPGATSHHSIHACQARGCSWS